MRRAVLTLIIILSVAFAGCGSGAVKATDDTSIRFEKDGSITHTVVEPFNDGEYEIDELREMISSDIDEFFGGEGISLKRAEETGDDVRVVMTYTDSGLFEDFNGEKLFFGTISEAESEGYKMRDGNFVNAADPDGSTMGAFDDTAKHVIISAVKEHIIAPYKITFMTEGAKILSDTEADATDVENDYVYLILER